MEREAADLVEERACGNEEEFWGCRDADVEFGSDGGTAMTAEPN